MRFNIVTLMPKMIEGALQEGVVGQAFAHGALELHLLNPRAFTEDTHQTVDDRPFGGGDGMVMAVEPLRRAVMSLKKEKVSGEVIYLSPHGDGFSDEMAREMSQSSCVTLVCGRYGGVDQRFIDEIVDREVSVGDYILSGGELGALVMLDAISRFIPGVLGNAESPNKESFGDGLLEAPQYTRPRDYNGVGVPEVLLSGDHQKIAQWRREMSLKKTRKLRPDLFKQAVDKGWVTKEEKEWISQWEKLDHDH